MLNVFDIQFSSYHDGPGIRTVIFLKGCNLSCLWCQNPESQKVCPELLHFDNLCIRCGKCVDLCPHHCFSVFNNKKVFNRDLCDACGVCVDNCVSESLQLTGRKMLEGDILDEIMLKAIPAPRAEVSKWAPKMLATKVPVDKIREVIGSGGKVIQKISAECDVKIDISEDGSVFVSGIDKEKAEQAINIINTIANDPEIGAIYRGKVVKIMNFGAFVEILPGKEGLVHISQLSTEHVDKVEDVVSVGDEIVVKVTEIDNKGRINLSRKAVLMKSVQK